VAAGEKFPSHPYAAVHYEYRELKNPPQQVHIVRIDLTDKNVHIRAVPGGPDPDGPEGKWECVLNPPSKVAEREGFDVVVNGDFFQHLNKKDAEGAEARNIFKQGIPASPLGPCMTDGKLWAPTTRPRQSVIVDNTGHVSIERIIDPPANAFQIMGTSNERLINDGKNVAHTGTQYLLQAHPRTAVGLADHGKTLVLIVADGRRKGEATGYKLDALADLMLAEGCEDAVNLDGGGSSVLAIRDPSNGKMKILNHPSDGHERPVANVLGVSITSSNDHAK
jgi:exopolysaccharide biosynthesis protein